MLLRLRLYNASCNRYGEKGADSIGSLLYFLLVCAIAWLDQKCLEFGVGLVNWRPLTSEDDIMMLTPFMVKKHWHWVTEFPVSSLTRQEEAGVSGWEWQKIQAPKRKVHV